MGGKKIEGPSIGLAMAVAREWSTARYRWNTMKHQRNGSLTPTSWIWSEASPYSGYSAKKKGKGMFKKLQDDRAEDMTF